MVCKDTFNMRFVIINGCFIMLIGSPMTQVVRAHTLGSRHSKGSRHEYRERMESNQYHGGSEDGYVTFYFNYLFIYMFIYLFIILLLLC